MFLHAFLLPSGRDLGERRSVLAKSAAVATNMQGVISVSMISVMLSRVERVLKLIHSACKGISLRNLSTAQSLEPHALSSLLSVSGAMWYPDLAEL